MGKFVLGLIVGVVIALLAMSYDPNLPQELRASLANVTALVMRGTQRAAEGVGEAADQVADEAKQAVGEPAEPNPPVSVEPSPPPVTEEPSPPPAATPSPAPEQ